jgi:hypothetical protein
MAIVGGGVILDKLNLSECAIGTNVCAPNELKNIQSFLAEKGIVAKNEEETIEILKSMLKVETEAEIWNNPVVREIIGSKKADLILKNLFVPEGPKNSTALLDNENIDNTLELWMKYSQKLFGLRFYHIPFQMIDFEMRGTELATLNIMDLVRNKYDCFGVVLNTDISSGRGKHWFCIYCDLKHSGNKEDPYSLEYFNSSGNRPMTEVNIWLEKTCHNLLKIYKKYCEITRSAPRRLQYSQTECGMWSLMYIKSRLMGHKPDWFFTVRADDEDMIGLRAQFFRKVLFR